MTKKKTNKQTKNTHPHANNRMLPSLFFFPFFQNENKIGRSVWSVEDSNMKNKQRKRTLKQRKCWSAGGKATIKKSVRFLEKGEKCLPSFFKLFFSHPWAAFGRIGDKHGKLGFRAQDSVGSHFNFFFLGCGGRAYMGGRFSPKQRRLMLLFLFQTLFCAQRRFQPPRFSSLPSLPFLLCAFHSCSN